MSNPSLTAKYSPCNNKGNKEQQKNNDGEQLQDEIKKESDKKLKFSTAQKMIFRFLTTDRLEKESLRKRTNKIEYRCIKYTKEELAQKLNISLKQLERFRTPYFYKSMVNKISLQLIRLYCSTKWVDNDFKS